MRYPKATPEELQAPKGMFRVIAVDPMAAASPNYHLGDFETFSMAEKIAQEKAGVGSPVFIFDDSCALLVRFGSWH